MSSGARLLQQLQARREQQLQEQQLQEQHREQRRQRQLEREQAPAADREEVSPKSDSDDRANDANENATPSSEADRPTRTSGGGGRVAVEVCLGPDCSGGGGGAALLEIEDLVARSHASSGSGAGSSANAGATRTAEVLVVGGGCRDHCTVGPNVYVRREKACGAVIGGGGDAHFTKVDSPKVCRRVFRAAADAAGIAANDTPEKVSAGTERILLLREDGRRWRALRERATKERRLRARERRPAPAISEGR